MQHTFGLLTASCLAFFGAILLLQMPAAINAQVPFPGSCPKVKLLEEFDLNAYTGIWYEYSKYPFVFEIGKKCMYARYDNLGNDTVGVINVAINRITNSNSSVQGTAKVLGPGQLAVSFSSKQTTDTANYIVLGTDYTTYALVYSCVGLPGIAHTRVVWILTRERKPSDETVTKAKQVMIDNDLSQSFLILTMQDDCPAVGNETPADQSVSETIEMVTLSEEQLNGENNAINKA